MKRTLGVCYYPEHWPMDQWAIDARDMVAAGLSWVRIGEFAWSRLEPSEGDFQFEWLDRAIETLGEVGLKIILGTPTATPPKWVLEKYPDMLAVDEKGRPRKFGSRRHYCFSHEGFQSESRRITRVLVKRYGKNPHIAAWQTDNEYGCHDTTRSYSNAARLAFQNWLAQRYQSTDAMNRAWGNVFWSMEYDTFDQVDLPNLTVTEANHPHLLAFRRFSSDQVVAFNRIQVDEIRAHSDAPIIHNYMGRVTDFDHYAVGADLDIASWDSYPIGFLSDRLEATDDHKARYLRQGDPDMQAFHHDLYRAVGKGRWWIMEQQPGPVNWAPYNPAPLAGMARLWAWEAFAHGAETVCYFRWRQAPFAQEQMHAGLQRPDGVDAPAMAECKQVADEIANLPDVGTATADVALIFDYHSCWAWESQPQGADFDMFRLALASYRALRRAGLSVDIISPDHPIDQYKLVLAPGLMHVNDDLNERLAAFDGVALLGPRTGLKTDELSIPIPMGPNLPNLDATVSLLESIPPNSAIKLDGGGQFLHWFEHLEGQGDIARVTIDGKPAIMHAGGLHYMAGWPDDDTYLDVIKSLCTAAGIETLNLPDGLRVRDTQTHRFYINYAPEPCEMDGITINGADVVWVKRG
ncbi:beta-galactosidase [Amylibacter ulvae]|uniref:Beta-galactosidase n=1 Tax=Paramylibacter ulvae TaxID=1651968 RepID=A0ABQ3D0U6_9RHOB|nr:beta-galactosidase [Amylibacter ulvae]GHA45266.1 beta-galactosidase [Amylibacter ulvae]